MSSFFPHLLLLLNHQHKNHKYCARCGKGRTDDVDSNICGSCADDLRAEEDAERMMTQASDEELARQEYEAREEKNTTQENV